MLLGQLRDYIIGSVFDLGKETLVKKHNNEKLISLIEDYLSREVRFNELATQAEEIDYDGFCSFVSSETFKKLMIQRIDGNTDERRRARESLWNQAVEYAHADTEEKRRKVAKLFTGISDIIQDFFVSQLGHGEHILAARIEDHVSAAHEDLATRIDRLEEKTNTTLDCFTEMVRNRDMTGAAGVIDSFLHAADTYHDLKGYYRFAPMTVGDHTSLYSLPLSQEALKKYPPNLRVEEETTVCGKKMPRDKALEYAIKHQVPVHIEITKATAYLGNQVDPAQGPAEAVIGKRYDYLPPPLSPIYDCRIVVDNALCYQHIELSIAELLEDGTYVLNNRKQSNSDLIVEFKYRENNLIDTHFEIKNGTTQQLLDFDRFTKCAANGATVEIINNKTDESIVMWIQEESLAQSQFGTIDDEIDLLERILCVEQHYETRFEITTISQKDYNYLCFLSDMLNGKRHYGEWEVFDLELKVTDKLKNLFENCDGEFGALYGPVEVEDTLFDKTLGYRFFRFLSRAKMIDFERKKKQVELADIGESVKLKFSPMDNPGKVMDVPLQEILDNVDAETRKEIEENDELVLIPPKKRESFTGSAYKAK